MGVTPTQLLAKRNVAYLAEFFTISFMYLVIFFLIILGEAEKAARDYANKAEHEKNEAEQKRIQSGKFLNLILE